MSASMYWMAWNSAIGLPNCTRSLGVARAPPRSAARPMPTAQAPMPMRPRSSTFSGVDEAADRSRPAAARPAPPRRPGSARWCPTRAAPSSRCACPARKPGVPRSTTNAVSPFCFLLGRGRGQHHVDLGHRALRDEGLAARDAPIRSVLPVAATCPRRAARAPASEPEPGSVRPHAPSAWPRGQPRQVPRPLRLGAGQVDVVDAQELCEATVNPREASARDNSSTATARSRKLMPAPP